jgi:hypothetical protein
MSTSVDTGLNPFNFIRKHFLQICLWDVSNVRSYCNFISLSVRGQSRYTAKYRSLSAQRLSERTIQIDKHKDKNDDTLMLTLWLNENRVLQIL